MKRTRYAATPNARFWYFARNGWVRFTLRPGQSLRHSRSSYDEGWSCVSFTLTHQGDHVEEQYSDRGSDCDGRYSHGGRRVCPLEDLAKVPAYNAGGTDHLHNGQHIHRPEFQAEKEYHRDYSAEAAGY